MLLDVITRLAADTGYNLEDQREALLLLLQKSADQMHAKLECNRIHREISLMVPGDSVVALPSFIGELKGMRMHTNELPFDLHSLMNPRYITTTLQYKFKNWRDMGECAINTTLSSVAPLTIECQNPEGVDLLISGQTDKAAKIEEVVNVAAATQNTINLFGPSIFMIACLTKRTCNIVIKDENGTEIAVLANNENKTRYKLVDVSQIFWTQDASDGASIIDVCYKLRKSSFVNDSDSFYAGDDYDEAWYHWAMHLYYAKIEGKEAASREHRSLAVDAIRGVKDSTEQSIVKKLSFGRNRFFGLFRKYRYFPGSVTNVDNNVQS